jgi:photosystem II stability/assembly factor-like uncharacterized protein
MFHARALLVVLFFPPALAGAQPADFDGWRLMPVRSQGEFERGEPGGRAEQYMQGATRCQADPNVVYLSHDCSLPWRSVDGGRTWEKPLGIGLYLAMGQSIAVDPVDCRRVLMIMDNSWDYRHPEFTGIYLSEDAGDHWTHVLHGPTLHSRRYEHDIAWAADSIDAGGAQRWYAALYNEAGEPDNADAALRISVDRGRTWTAGASLAGTDPVYEVQVSPTDGRDLLVATSAGLLRSTDGGLTLQPVTGLPSGSVSSVAFDPTEARTIYAVLFGGTPRGVYRSTDGGASFTRLTVADGGQQAVLDQAIRLVLHPTDGRVFYVLPESDGQALRTADAGATFATTSFDLPDDVRAWRWGIRIGGTFGFVLPSALDTTDVVAQSLGAAMYRSSDGLVFVNGSTLFEGANCGLTNYNVAYDPVDPARFALGNADIGMMLTENGADWFLSRSIPWEWVGDITAWGSQHTLDFRPGHPGEMASVVGDVFDKILIYTADYGLTWQVANDVSNHYWRVAYHPTNPDIVWAGDKRSTDGGRNYTRLPFPAALDEAGLQVLSYCIADPDTIYAVARSSGNILRSDDTGDTWTLYATAPGSVAPFDPIITFASSPADCNVVYALDGDGDLARYDGAAWESLGVLDHVTAPADYFHYVRSVQVDPRHAEIIYAGIFGSGLAEMILRSTDGGGTWQDISYNRFRDGVSGINISPLTGEVMVGGCSGTWVFPPPYDGTGGVYEDLVPRPSCLDGLQNGEETGIDCGGSRCPSCGGEDGGDASSDAPGETAGDTTGDTSGDASIDTSGDASGDGPGDGSTGGGDAGGCGCRAGGHASGIMSFLLIAAFAGLSLRRVGRAAVHPQPRAALQGSSQTYGAKSVQGTLAQHKRSVR